MLLRTESLYSLLPHRLRNSSWQTQHESALVRIREFAGDLRNVPDHALQRAIEELRTTAQRPGETQVKDLANCFALTIESLRRTRGIELYDCQILAGLAMARGAVAEMQTGEGKTFATLTVAVWRALAGRGVHVVTPNFYLAERDCELLRPAFELLGLTVGLLPEKNSPEEKRSAYLADVTYGSGYEFGFDYLRDQWLRRSQPRHPLGTALLKQWNGEPVSPVTVQRGLATAIVDEIDNVLLDDATSPLVLGGSDSKDASDSVAHHAARKITRQLVAQQDYVVDSLANSIRLTPAGLKRIHASDAMIPIDMLRRSWAEYIEQALHVDTFLRRDVHYVVDGDEVQIVDSSTGRIFQDRSWKDGLHQAVEAKEGVRVTAERSTLAQITRQRFYRRYENLCGMTGTATGCETEFRYVYKLAVIPIAPRLPSRRRILPMRSFATAATKHQAILDDVRKLHATGRPVLIGTRTIVDSEALAKRLASASIPFQLLNGRQDADEAAVISRAGERNAVTIATNLAGRGTDIRLAEGVADLGGLHVIVAECHPSARSDRQLIGRCARQGDPGSAQSFLSAEDAIVERFGPWLIAYLERHCESDGELKQDLTATVQRLQHLSERAEYAGRCALLRQDNAQDALWTGPRERS